MGKVRTAVFVVGSAVVLAACTDEPIADGKDAATFDHIDTAVDATFADLPMDATTEGSDATATDADADADTTDADATDAESRADHVDVLTEGGADTADAHDADSVADHIDVSTEDGDASLDTDGSDGACPGTPVNHGQSCSTDGAQACGRLRSCTDVDNNVATECICQGGRFSCGTCPHCSDDLREFGCGIGQVCDGVTFTLCDGTTREVSGTCSCQYGRSWSCDGSTFAFCAEAGTGAADAKPDQG